MLNTLKLLQPFIDNNLSNLSLNELALMYQKSPETKILATAYNKIYKLAIIVKDKYWGLTEEDIASHCLEKLEFCLKTYEKGYQFTTYFCTVFSNKLREETENINRKKRKCILESINDIIYIGIEDTYNLLELVLPKNLTDKEYKFCKLASQGYDNKYIANELSVSVMTVSNLKKSLRIKLFDLQNN